jgi:signal transduction histidine kinase/iron only hydrogenase large subunit-like protein
MVRRTEKPLVTTIREHCRVCYTCVRECPAKAIRIVEGQAEVVGERCIGCGNCVRVCSQKAKKVLSSVEQTRELLAGDAPVAVCLAPSFPAEFVETKPERVVGALRQLGFDYVHEVAFGADLVAREYRRLIENAPSGRHIASTCPAIVAYVERYHPALVERLAPIVSPMVALARYLKQQGPPGLKILFIGPCIAKKGEAASTQIDGEVDAVLTFSELRGLISAAGIDLDGAEPGEFDPPVGGYGALFAISRGLLQAASIREDLVNGDVVAAEGRTDFVEAIKEFESGDLDARLLEVLCCNGCIMGPGMSINSPLFSRRSRVSRFVRSRLEKLPGCKPPALSELPELDLTRSFIADDQRILDPSLDEIGRIMARMGKLDPEDELNCGACGYETCREHAVAIYKGLAESEMCLPYTIEQLRSTVGELADSNDKLASARDALRQSEKLATMGQMAAGIAHEVNNPLGVVLMYAHILLDEFGNDPRLNEDLGLIAEQADRCKKIVSGLLHFARRNKVNPAPCDLWELIEDTIRSVTVPAGVKVAVEHSALSDPVADLDHDQIIQVLTNLVSNATTAMPGGGTLTVELADHGEMVRIVVRDTGVGIPKENLSKIFEPFFSTKQLGVGTGLGLAVTYGIVKMHCGEISVSSNNNPDSGPTGTAFDIRLPRRMKK